MQKKILTIFLIIFFSITLLNLNEVFGVGIVSQCWNAYVDGDDKPDLVYRMFMTPYKSTYQSYHKTNSSDWVEGGIWTYTYDDEEYTAKWVSLLDKGLEAPTDADYNTLKLALHSKPIGDYSIKGENYYGYNVQTVPISGSLETLTTAIETSGVAYTTPGILNSYDSTVFYEVIGINGKEQVVDWGTGLKVTGLSYNKPVEWRYTIIKINGNHVYVSDSVIFDEDIANFIPKAKEVGNIDGCYVSSVLISRSHHTSGGYEVSETGKAFTEQYGKGIRTYTPTGKNYQITSNWWAKQTRGRETPSNNALGSVLNLYDNVLVFPQMSNRTVLVRHINIGNNTTISTEIVENGTPIPSTDITLKANERIVTGSDKSLNYTGYQEYYEGLVDMDETVTKQALSSTMYRCIGHNIAVSTSLGMAEQSIASSIAGGKYNNTPTAISEAKDLQSDSDYVVIDFYYTEYEKDVEVNHIYLDEEGTVLGRDSQTIVPNETAITNNTVINRINTDRYIRERYAKQMGYDVIVRVADSLEAKIKAGEVEYKGYQVLDKITDINSIIGTKPKNLNKQTTANITSNDAQVNFYYVVKEKIIEEEEPEKNIDGQVFVVPDDSKEVINTDCYDTLDKLNISSIPSGTYATVGIKGIPRYMIGAITAKYVSPQSAEYSIGMKFELSMAGEKKTINIADLRYRVGYYKITDMAVYKLKNTTIYDAETTGTLGKRIFNWEQNKLNTLPKSMDLSVRLTGINGTSIANNDTQINNINNYVKVELQDKNGKQVNANSVNTITYRKTYLTRDEFNEVNAYVEDNAINEYDKEFADSELQRYYNIWQEKLNIQNEKQQKYDDTVLQRQTLLDRYNEAIAELERRKDAFDEAETEKSDRLGKLYQAKKDLDTLQKTTLPNLIKELNELIEYEQEVLEQKQDEERKLNSAEQIKSNLYNAYLNSVDERNRLAQNANCNDEIDEEVYIYLEPDEKEAKDEEVRRCKEAKQAYVENLENQVVEKAQKSYEDYFKNGYTQAVDALNKITADYNIVVYNKQEKEKQITDTQLEIRQKTSAYNVMQRNYNLFISAVYTPAKNAYESYRDATYANAKAAYESYVEAKHVEVALEELNLATQEATKAKGEYDTYNAYRNNLYKKYDEYKAKYDEYMNLTNTNIASILGLKLTISVQNMSVKLNNKDLTSAKNNKATKTFDVQTALNDSTNIPQVTTERPTISRNVYNNIEATYTKVTDYNNSNFINENRINGIRALAGKADYEAQVVIGSKNITDIKDTIYYSDQRTDAGEKIFRLKTTTLSQTYKVNTSATTAEEKYKQTIPINIYTPITVSATLESNTSQIVNQTGDKEIVNSMIQLNTDFKINLSNNAKSPEYNLNNTNRYSGGYYVKFDFDVHKVSINGVKYNHGNRIPAGTWIGIIPKKNGKAYITAQAYGSINDVGSNIASEENNSYTVRAVAYNVTDLMLNRSTRFENLTSMTLPTSELKDMVFNICKNPSYFAEETYDVIIINRAFDFRVTDVKDINWKSVFRKTTSTNTNSHTGLIYYSGSTKWNTDADSPNDIMPRTTSEIGRNPIRILPIGAYKHTDITYIKAPKMGYRFSYDLKVTGAYYNSQGEIYTNKKVNIATKFYYISKDGKEYLKEYDGTSEGIYLFYKTSAGKYVRIDQTGGGYNLTFTPNDGYRYVVDDETSTLAKTSRKLGHLRNMTLTYEMATVADNSGVITYYGEYKLPNSTIAVKVNADGSYNINEKLKNGYIGVVFDIVAYTGKSKVGNITKDVELSYSKNTQEDKPNTSQWDYEGFLSYENYGHEIPQNNPLTLRLENGTWKITNKVYNEIKGSVMLYDLDERAATDYE